jgi:hypothetical protein
MYMTSFIMRELTPIFAGLTSFFKSMTERIYRDICGISFLEGISAES